MKINQAYIDQTLGTTSEKAVAAIGNRYDLILIAAQRVRELHRGDAPLVKPAKNATVTALIEIETKKISREYLTKTLISEPRRRKRRG